jgi:hypothetical protein
MSETLPIYVVYFNAKDYPGVYVARRQVCGAFNGVPTVKVDPEICAWSLSLDALRSLLPPGLHRIPPMPGDDPVVVEVWL